MRTKLQTWLALGWWVTLSLPVLLVCLPDGTNAGASEATPAIGGGCWGASVLVAGAAALLAIAIGAALAGLFTLTDFPQPALGSTLALLPFVCPPAVWALGQVHGYGPGGLAERALGDGWRPLLVQLNSGHYLATVVVLAQIHAPLAMLIVGRGLSRVHLAGFEAALQCLPRRRLLRWLLGAVRGELTAAFLLAFALGLGNFAVPHVLQCRLYAIAVYERMTNYLDATGAAWAAIPLLLPTLIAAGLMAVSEGGAVYATAVPQRRLRVRLGRRAWLAGGLLVLYLGLTTGLPLAATVTACQSWSHFLTALREAAPETENSVAIGLGAAAVACAGGLIMAAGIAGRARSWLNVAGMLPLGVPALIVGLAFARFFNRTGPVDLSGLGDTSWLVVLGLGFRGWPFATRVLVNGQRQQAPEWHELTRLSPVSRWRRWTWISGPLLADQLAAGAILAYVLAVGDVELSQMLCAPGEGTLALRLFTFLHFGPSHVAASLAVVQWIIAALPVLIYYLACDRCLPAV